MNGEDDGEYYREASHERLLTREQIDMLENLDDLVAIQDDVTATAKRIEVDLEFRSDDRADEDWEHRARGALTAHYVCNGHLTRRIAYLRRGGKVPKQHDNDSKARRKEAQALLEREQAENRRLKALKDREVTVRAMVAFADRQSLLAHFKIAAQRILRREQFAAIMDQAKKNMLNGIEGELPDLASRIEARSDETPQEVRPEGQEPDPKGDAQPSGPSQ